MDSLEIYKQYYEKKRDNNVTAKIKDEDGVYIENEKAEFNGVAAKIVMDNDETRDYDSKFHIYSASLVDYVLGQGKLNYGLYLVDTKSNDKQKIYLCDYETTYRKSYLRLYPTVIGKTDDGQVIIAYVKKEDNIFFVDDISVVDLNSGVVSKQITIDNKKYDVQKAIDDRKLSIGHMASGETYLVDKQLKKDLSIGDIVIKKDRHTKIYNINTKELKKVSQSNEFSL